MLSLLCFHGPQRGRSSLVSLVPSVQWGQPSLVVWWGRGGQGPRPWGRGADGALAGGKSLFLSRGVPHSPSPEARFSVLLLLPQPQVETAPASLFPPQPPSWWSGGRKFGELPWPVFSPLSPALGVSHLWAPGRGRVPRDLVPVSHNTDACVAWAARPPGAGPVSPCVPGRGPGPAHHYSPESWVTDSPRARAHTLPVLGAGPGLLSSGQQKREAGLWVAPQAPLWFHPPSLGTQPWAEEEKPCILLLSPWNVL